MKGLISSSPARGFLVLSSYPVSITTSLVLSPLLRDFIPTSAFGMFQICAGLLGQLASSVQSFTGRMSALTSSHRFVALILGVDICPYLDFVLFISSNLKL